MILSSAKKTQRMHWRPGIASLGMMADKFPSGQCRQGFNDPGKLTGQVRARLY